MMLGAGAMAWLRHTLVAGIVVTVMTIGAGSHFSRAETTQSCIRVVVWDEQQPEQNPSMPTFLIMRLLDTCNPVPG